LWIKLKFAWFSLQFKNFASFWIMQKFEWFILEFFASFLLLFIVFLHKDADKWSENSKNFRYLNSHHFSVQKYNKIIEKLLDMLLMSVAPIYIQNFTSAPKRILKIHKINHCYLKKIPKLTTQHSTKMFN